MHKLSSLSVLLSPSLANAFREIVSKTHINGGKMSSLQSTLSPNLETKEGNIFKQISDFGAYIRFKGWAKLGSASSVRVSQTLWSAGHFWGES